MAKKLIFILYCFAAFLPYDLCSGMGTTKEMSDNKTITIKKQDNGKEIGIKCGDMIRIELTEMGGAGYGWYVDNLNTEYLDLLSKETKVISEGKVGAPVVGVWLFGTKKKGAAEIKMDLYRIWEGREKATEHFSIKILIE